MTAGGKNPTAGIRKGSEPPPEPGEAADTDRARRPPLPASHDAIPERDVVSLGKPIDSVLRLLLMDDESSRTVIHLLLVVALVVLVINLLSGRRSAV